MMVNTKITIADDINRIELSLGEAREVYLELKRLFDKDATVDYRLDTPWKDPTIGIVPNGGLQACGKHYRYEICDCAMENK